MAESACASFCVGKNLNLFPLHLLMTGDNHLSYTLSIFYDKILDRKINEDDAYFTPIVSINCSRRIQHGDAPFDGKSASRAHLCFVSWRKGDVESRRHQTALKGLQHQRIIQIGPQIHSSRERCGIRRERMTGFIDNLYVHEIISKSRVLLSERGFGRLGVIRFLRDTD